MTAETNFIHAHATIVIREILKLVELRQRIRRHILEIDGLHRFSSGIYRFSRSRSSLSLTTNQQQ